MKRLCAAVEAALKGLLVGLVALMTVVVLWQVVSRALRAPSKWTEELAGFLLAWVALLGAAYAFRKNQHLGFDLVYSAMGEAGKKVSDVATLGSILAFSLIVLVYGGVRLMWITMELGQTMSVLHWPMWIVYIVLPLSGALISLFAVDALARRLKGESP